MLDEFYNINSFEEYILENTDNVEILRGFGTSSKEVLEKVKKLIEENDDIYAIYTSSARRTVQICKAAIDMGFAGKIKLVGNDCFQESIEYLKQGVLTAIVDKKIPMQSYLAMQVLFNYVVKGEYPSSSLLYVQPSIVIQSNATMEFMMDDSAIKIK